MLVSFGASAPVFTPRNLFWVGGTGNFPDSGHWSLTSGGAGGAPAPRSVDTVTLDGSSGGGTVTMTGAVSVASVTMGAFTGTLSTNAQTVTAQSFSNTGTATRALDISNSTLNITGTSGAVWNFTTVTGLTFTATNSTINISGNGNRTPAFGAALTYGTVNITGSGSFALSNLATTFVNFSRTGSAATTDSITLAGIIVTGTLTLAGNSQTSRLLVSSSSAGTNRTVTAAAVALSNVDFANITAAGVASPFTGTSLGNAHGNVNITFTGAVTRYLVNAGGKSYSDMTAWSATSGGATGATMPLPQDTAVADINSFSAGQTFTVDVPRIGAQDWSMVTITNNPTLAFAQAYFLYGSIDIPARSFPDTGGVLMTGGFTGSIANQSGTLDINLHLTGVHLNAFGFPSSMTMTAPGGTVRLLGHFQCAGFLTVNSGTFNANNFDLQYTGFISTGTATRAVQMGSGTWLTTSNGVNTWNVTSTGMTLTPSTSTIKFYSASNPARTFAGAGLTYNNFIDTYHDGLDNSGAQLIVTGANTFNEFRVVSQSVARTVTFPAGLTNAFGSFIADGRSGALCTLNSSTSGTPATLSDAAGTNAMTFMSIKDIAATGGATWTATNSVNVSGNSGITITP
jgi:hypothetical protein